MRGGIPLIACFYTETKPFRTFFKGNERVMLSKEYIFERVE